MKPLSLWRSTSNSLFALLLGALSAGCAVDARSSDDDAVADQEDTGSVGLSLRVGDVVLDSVTYVITGNGYTKTGSFDVSNSSKVSALIAGIPAGNAYSVTLSASAASDSGIVCGGSASFNVTARSTTIANVKLECKLPGSNNGSVQVNGTTNVCPRIDALSVTPSEVLVGGTMALSAQVTDSDALPAAASYAWTANGGGITGASLANATFTCTAAGSFEIALAVSDTQCGDSATATVTCSTDPNAQVTNVKVNEVESNGGTPGDWTELFNAGTTPANISGWVFKDNDDTHAYTIPAGTVIAPGGYFIVEEAAQGFGLGSADSARLFNASGILVDSYSWTAHATVTYGRCANGTGDFAQTPSTKGAANDCTPPRPNVKINEVESNGGTPGDWTELYNADSVAANISGWSFKDNDDTHNYLIPAGTIIPPGGYFLVEEVAQGFGLGGADSVRLFDATGAAVDSYAWTAHATETYGRCPNGVGAFGQTASSKGASNSCTAPAPIVKINEVESNGGTPGDWTELYNAGSTPADISGWSFKDNDDTHNYVFPAGTVIPVGGYYLVEEAAQTFGLGGADSVRLFDLTGTVVDQYTWAAHATATYGRCPNGTGDFAQTASSKGLANTCAAPPGTPVLWPGQNDVKTLDVPAQWTSNLSGLTYEAGTSSSPAVLWAVVNGPGTLYRLLWNGTNYLPDTVNDWSAGKALHYPNGAGNPDSESVTFGASPADGFYVATERNNDASTVSRLAVLRFDASAAGSSLTATHEWNITSLLPTVGANLGLEAITWIPDSYLVSKGFFDEAAGHAYNPSEYAAHGTGLFFVGIEGNGILYAFALNHGTGAATLVATIVTGQTGVMSLEFDREVGYLWFGCDDTCANKSGIFTIDQTAGSSTLGRFTLRRMFDRPSSLPDTNNEGIAIAPESECVNGFKPFFWSDDNDKDTFSLRKDSIPCGSFL